MTRIIDETERKIYSAICRRDGVKAKDIALEAGADKKHINYYLYASPFISDLCYRDADFMWHGLIRQSRPHIGLESFCGYYADVDRFLEQPEDEWLTELMAGCRNIGRNLNDTRGLLHSFKDTRAVMIRLFKDLDEVEYGSWEICFELRIRRARYIRIYADVLVITEDKVFSLEFKMKDRIDEEEERQAVKYAEYLEVIFGEAYEVIPALVLSKASDLYTWAPIKEGALEVPVCSGDMLFNLFNEFLAFWE